MKKLCFLIALFLFGTALSLIAQNVGINNDGSLPHPSAGLDVKYADKGVLIPRVALVQTSSAAPVTSPAISLLVYNTETINDVTPGYYYWGGTTWIRLSASNGTSGTANFVTKWTAAGTLGNSQLFDDGTNVGIGTATPGAKLDVAGPIWQTNTGQSVYIGEGSGAVVSPGNKNNVFVGYQAGNQNTDGNVNTAIGYQALFSNTTGAANTSNGFWALFLNTTGCENVANGISALLSNTTGSGNTANGSSALTANTTGSANTANGLWALASNTTGIGNTANGYNTLSSITNGFYNTALGYNADVGAENLTNATAIGANAIVGASNSLVLGDNSVNVGIGTSTPTAKLDVNGSVKITDGTQGADKVLTSDANGLASWQDSELTELASSIPPVGCIQSAGIVSTGMSPTSVAVSGNYAYVTNANSNTMTIYNVSVPDSPVQVGSVSTGQYPIFVAVSGSYAYVANWNSSTMTIYDVSIPASPVQVGSVSTGSYPAWIAISGGYAYVVNSGSNTITIYDISVPEITVQVESVSTGSAPNSIALSGNYAYVANAASSSITIYDISVPESTVQVGSVSTEYGTNVITVSGNYAYVLTNNSETITIYNISAPVSPVQVGSIITGPSTNSIAISGNYAYVTNHGSNTMTIYDVSVPESPVQVGSLSTGSYPYSVAVSGNYAYVANFGNHTMQIFQVSCLDNNILLQDGNLVLVPTTWSTSNNNIYNANLGNVGIGTSSPSSKLDVNGNIGLHDGALFLRSGGSDVNHGMLWSSVVDGPEFRGAAGFVWKNGNAGTTELMRLTSTGLGIGTSSPSEKLDVNGTIKAQDFKARDEIGFRFFDNNSAGYLQINNAGGTWISSYASEGNLSPISFSSNVGIGTSSPAEKLDVVGNIKAKYVLTLEREGSSNQKAFIKHQSDDKLYVFNDNTGNTGVVLNEGANTWSSTSDVRLKKNIEPVTGILNNVCELSVKRYHYKTDPDTMKKRLGFIAQDVQLLFPDLVNTDADYLSLSYTDFGVLSIEAIKELRAEKDAEIARLSQENAELNKKLESMQAQIEVIKGYLGVSAVK